METPQLELNSAKCKKCGDVLISKHRHDFNCCTCGSVCVDGGLEYIRRVGYPSDYEELNKYVGS